jgi:hypothetical protein
LGSARSVQGAAELFARLEHQFEQVKTEINKEKENLLAQARS